MVEHEISFKQIKERFNDFLKHPETVKFIGLLKKYGFIMLILIPLLVGYSIRMVPTQLPITKDLAKKGVYTSIEKQIRTEITAQYPNLPQQKLEELINQRFSEYLTENKAEIDKNVAGTADYFKSRFQDKDGHTYLLAIDPYFWARLANNVADHGYPGDYKREHEGKIYNWDSYMIAPIGRPMPADMFHAYFEGYLLRAVRFFDKGVIPEHVYFYTPIILISLAVIIAFIIAKRIGGNVAGFFAGAIIAIHPVVTSRTLGGFADTDAYNVFFPLLIFWIFLLSFDSASRIKKICFGILAGCLIGLFSIAWGGWWYILIYVILTCMAYMAFAVVRNWKKSSLKEIYKNRDVLWAFFEAGLVSASSILSVILFRGWGTITGLYGGISAFVRLHQIRSIWPNVFTTVAEQSESSFAGAISQLGGNLLFCMAILGIIATLYLTKRKGKLNITYFVFLSLWLFSACWAATRGVRFALLATPAFAIAFGLAISTGIVLTTKVFEAINLNSPFFAKSALFFIGLLILGLLPGSNAGIWGAAKQTAKQGIPVFNDAWYATLEKIRLESEPDAIINSWWDFGHWFKYVGGRAVTFDGTSQNMPQAHWIGKVLLTSNETEAIGILRMLDCDSYRASEHLAAIYNASRYVEEGFDTAKAVEVIKKVILTETIDEANDILDAYSVSKETKEKIIRSTKCQPPENYLITSEDMIRKGGVWGHFGSWNFERTQIYRDTKDKFPLDNAKGIEHLQTRFNLSEDAASSMYHEISNLQEDEADSWIAPWPDYGILQDEASVYLGCDNKTNNTIRCGQGVTIDMENKTIWIGDDDNLRYPSASAISYNGTMYKTEYDNNIIEDIGIFYSHNRNWVIVSHPLFVDSMFNRLHFDGGSTLKHFKQFSYQQAVNGDNIYVWKVDWEMIRDEDIFSSTR